MKEGWNNWLGKKCGPLVNSFPMPESPPRRSPGRWEAGGQRLRTRLALSCSCSSRSRFIKVRVTGLAGAGLGLVETPVSQGDQECLVLVNWPAECLYHRRACTKESGNRPWIGESLGRLRVRSYTEPQWDCHTLHFKYPATKPMRVGWFISSTKLQNNQCEALFSSHLNVRKVKTREVIFLTEC